MNIYMQGGFTQNSHFQMNCTRPVAAQIFAFMAVNAGTLGFSAANLVTKVLTRVVKLSKSRLA